MASYGPPPVKRLDLLWVSVSAMIGSGWLFAPWYAAKIAGPGAIVSWLIGALLVMLCALTLAEISAMLPVAGGIIRFTQLSHGTFAGFSMGWMAWLSFIMVPVIEVQGLVQYSANYLPWLTETVDGQTTLSLPGRLVATGLLVAITGLNFLSIDKIARANAHINYVKLLVPVVMVIWLVGFYAHSENLVEPAFLPAGWSGVLAALPGAGIAFSFFGFNTAISFARDVQNPQRAIPFALIGSLAVCALLYMAVQWAFIVAVPPHFLAYGWPNVEFSGDAGPFVGLTVLLGLIPLSIALYAIAFFSPLGSALIMVTSNARIHLGMAGLGYFPAFFEKRTEQGIPARSLLLNLMVGLILLIAFPGWQQMVQFMIAAILFSHAFAPLSCWAFRRQLPTMHRPFRLPLPMGIAFAAFGVLNCMLYWCGWDTLWKMDLLLLLGYGWYQIQHRCYLRQHVAAHDMFHGWWIIPYALWISAITYAGTFEGGKQLITAPWDMLIIWLGSALTFYAATRSALPPPQMQAEIERALNETG